MEKSADAFRTISEVAEDLALPQHVLRFWETRFPQIRPLKRAGGRRYYRPGDVSLLKAIRRLLYDDGYTIKGVQRLLKEQGPKGLSTASPAIASDWEPVLGADIEPQAPEAPVDAEPTELTAGGAHALLCSHRDEIGNALTAIEECRRVLEAVLGSRR